MGLDSQPVAVKEESTKEHGQSSHSGIIQTAAFLNFLVSARGPYGSSLGRGGVISPGLPAERMLSSRFAVGRDRCYWVLFARWFRCADVLGATRREPPGSRINTRHFALLRYAAEWCGFLWMD